MFDKPHFLFIIIIEIVSLKTVPNISQDHY